MKTKKGTMKKSQMTLDALDQKETCEFIPAVSIVPRKWDKWFWTLFTEDADFSFGDNNRSLITAERFADHCRDLDLVENSSRKEVDKFMTMLTELDQTYIDLEN